MRKMIANFQIAQKFIRILNLQKNLMKAPLTILIAFYHLYT